MRIRELFPAPVLPNMCLGQVVYCGASALQGVELDRSCRLVDMCTSHVSIMQISKCVGSCQLAATSETIGTVSELR